MNPNYIPLAIIIVAGLVYLYERMRSAIPPQVVEDYKQLALKMANMIPVEYIPFVSAVANQAKPLVERVEKMAISETKALLKAYADQTNTPIDNAFCEWLDRLEEKAP